MAADSIAGPGIDPALAPLLRWADPLVAPSRERCAATWNAFAGKLPQRFDGARLRQSVALAFAAPALTWSCRALLLELAIARHQRTLAGETAADRLAHFLDRIDSAAGRSAIRSSYPALEQDIVSHAAMTERFLTTLLERLAHDTRALDGLFADTAPGRLTGFSMGQGDRHDHGGSVVTLTFEHGRALYKPRPMAMDLAWAQCLARLADSGVTLDQRATVSVDRGSYGYAAWVAHDPLPDPTAAARYFRRFGGLVAIAYLLNCTDLHLENLIACGEYPVLVDLETVCQPWIRRYDAADARVLPYSPSVLVSGLLPGQLGDEGAFDLSALAWAEHRFQTRRAANGGTDELRLAPTEVSWQHRPNLPCLPDGQRIAAHDHVLPIVEGFEETYRALHRNKARLADGALAPFATQETRTVLRSTHIYARLVDAMNHPQYLRSDSGRTDVLDRLEVGIRQWPLLARAEPAEREALARGDVPRFVARVDGTDVMDGDGHVIGGLCERSGREELARRLRTLSRRDLRRQRYALVQSLECDRLDAVADGREVAPPRRLPAARPYRGGDFLDTAVRLGEDLLAVSFHDRHGLILFHPEYRDGERARMSASGLSLYEGLPGVGLLLGELARQSGQARFGRAAEAVLATVRQGLEEDREGLTGIGAYDGLAGWIYVLLRAGVRDARPALIEEAVGWLPTLAARIQDDTQLDLIAGAAGALMVLVRLQRHAPAPAVRDAAQACAAHLIAKAHRGDDGTAWWTLAAPQEGPFSGIAHGSIGIALALARFGQAFGHREATALARAGLAHERACVARRGGRWFDRYDGVDDRADVASWCHGAPGAGLARLAWPEQARDEHWEDELRACVASTRAQGFDGEPSLSLCHGRLGNLDLLLRQACARGDRTLLDEARRLGQTALETARTGWICGLPSPGLETFGLMVGLTGIAYGCLRLAAPDAVPSVLDLSVD